MKIKGLSDIRKEDESVFGGKACGLASLISAGFNVPEGFAVAATTVPADRWPENEREEFRKKSGGLLAKGSVAVRSSAVGEDSPERSFAGMFETALNIRTSDEALGAATRCVASGYCLRVLEYAGTGEAVPVGLVVQQMIPARSAGVCFTRDPSGKDGAVVVEGTAGTGDAMISGHADPERWRAHYSGLKKWECRAETDLGVLNEPEISRIAEQAREIEKKIGMPADLEWAIDKKGRLWWLQARPITVLSEPLSYVIQRAAEVENEGPVTVWSNWNVRETMPDPLKPLSWTFWRDAVIPIIVPLVTGIRPSSALIPCMSGLDLVHGRIYFNMNKMASMPMFGRLSRIVSIVDATVAETFGDLAAKGAMRPLDPPVPKIMMLAEAVRALFVSMYRFSYGLIPGRAMRMLEADSRAHQRRDDLESLSNAELVREMSLFSWENTGRIMMGLHIEMFAMGVYALADAVFSDCPEARQCLARGIPANPTTKISIFIDDLVCAARPLAEVFEEKQNTDQLLKSLESIGEGRLWLKKLGIFLDRFGHRGPKEFELGGVRWFEDPSMIIDLVRAGLKSPSTETVRDRIRRMSAERAEAIQRAVVAAPSWKRPFMRILAKMAERFMPLREAPKHYTLFIFLRIRLAVIELGKRLAKEGVLEDGNDVFFLEWRELIDLAEGRKPGFDVRVAIAEREALHERFLNEKPPDILRSDGVPVIVKNDSDGKQGDGLLRGTGVSSGVAEGPVRVLTEPDPSMVSEGDVLVLRYADPGWTPLFPRAAAVVMEVGGLMCHAAVVAREMGIPAVFGVADATGLLEGGEIVKVDGESGLVERTARISGTRPAV